MLDGIVMNIVEKGFEFPFLIDRMLPEPPLPHVRVSMFPTRWRGIDFRRDAGDATPSLVPVGRPCMVGSAHPT